MNKPFAITLDVGSSLANHTGNWRTQRPVYLHRTPPCNDACPAGEDIQGWLYEAEAGHYEAAWRSLVEDNPLPAVMGRVCYHKCEKACNRGQLDEAVGIHAVERFLGDEAIRRGWDFAPVTQELWKRVLVVGAGPSGLSAAYHLRRRGHAVTVVDAGEAAGGMMRFGIPRYRLPREVLDAEVARIERFGVRFQFHTKVTDLAETMRAGDFDAAFLAVGAHLAKRAYLPAGDASRVLNAISVLRALETGEPVRLGRRVVVYGGGNTALDVARTAKRLGAEETVIVYRRTKAQMPAHEFELQEALEEGIQMRWLTTIKQQEGQQLLIEKMELDQKGFPQPTGEFEVLEADALVLALGQESDLEFLKNVAGLTFKDGVLEVDSTMMTGHPGLFAGGDMVPAERTVTVAIGHGKKAARHIDAWLRGLTLPDTAPPEVARLEHLNPWYYSDAPRRLQPMLDRARRTSTFEEVSGGLDESNALFEARRCLSCGNCFGCDNCFGVCPDNAVMKLGEGLYEFNYEFCKGCGICANECPCGAIQMQPEAI